YLSAEERADALSLSRGLRAAEAAFAAGERSGPALGALISAEIARAPRARLDYAEVVSRATLEPVERAGAGDAAVVAAWVGATRLIDNAILG
ncbi:MAG TPA: pantoate--beta-alanine ligase, partial [Planctomycetota bacterium]|nr:pantoate--beta-alanine ligase [Planctomycetota bacterium]